MGDLNTDCARRAMQIARDEAIRLNHQSIGSEHALLGLIKAECGIAWGLLTKGPCLHGLDLVPIIYSHLTYRNATVDSKTIRMTDELKRAVEQTLVESQRSGKALIHTHYLLLGLIHDLNGVAASIFMNAGIDLARMRAEILELSQAVET
jgi:ATP-dependent Clp protease ATP-binding subunit ClpC